MLLAFAALLGGNVVDSMNAGREPAEKSRSIESDGTFGRETTKQK